MEQQPYSQQPYQQQPFQQPGTARRGNAFASASISFGIMSLFTCLSVYPAVFFASLSILFGLLSRQESLKMPSPAQVGCALSAASLALIFVLVAIGCFFLSLMYGVDIFFSADKMNAALQDLLQRYTQIMEGMMQ